MDITKTMDKEEYARPNILILMTDQQSSSCTTGIDNKWLKTPGIDKIVKHGVRFTKAYCTQPLCCPSRNSMFTGRMPYEGGVYANVKMGDVTKSGRNTDLSAFGVDVFDWQDLEVEVDNNLALIRLNGEQVMEFPFQENIGSIVGFNINFTGTGAIDYLSLADKEGQMVYETDF